MSRRGYTLVEMLTAMTVGAVMLGIALSMLLVLVRAEQGGRDRVYQARVMSRLAEQFRSDANAAVRPISAKAGQKTEWQVALMGDQVVTYRALPGRIDREQRTGGKLVRQESYVLPAGRAAKIVVNNDSTPAVASLIIAADEAASAAGREIRITAMVGKDHRFNKSAMGGR
jgi:prepilin-type N-terminal cleavage/methylation domain-containing protein